MSETASIANKLKAGLSDDVKGLADIDVYKGMNMPTDYKITELLGDIIMAEYVDSDCDGRLVNRGGIFIDNDMSRNTWRVAEVTLTGPAVSDRIKVGTLVMFPNDKGIPAVTMSKKPAIFLNEERIFGIVEPAEQDKPAKSKSKSAK